MGKIFTALAGAIVVACSSSDAADPCPIVGSYSATATVTSGNCQLPAGAVVTDTLTAEGGGYELEITGTTGGCHLSHVTACQLQGKCEVSAADQLNPSDVGTVQYAWTFDKGGFHGTSTISLPPARSLPGGCMGQVSVQGARQ
jgi:hypothetical protein